MKGLAEFLTARLDEDEATARQVLASDPGARTSDLWGMVEANRVAVCSDAIRSLSEVAMKRALVEHADVVSGMDMQIESEWGKRGAVPWQRDEGVMILRQIAAVYDRHPDWCEDWRVVDTPSSAA